MADVEISLRVNGMAKSVRVPAVHVCGLFGLGPTARRAVAAEAAVTGSAVADVDADDLGRAALADLESVPSDLHGSAAYRERVGAAMVARAWRRAVREAGHV